MCVCFVNFIAIRPCSLLSVCLFSFMSVDYLMRDYFYLFNYVTNTEKFQITDRKHCHGGMDCIFYA